MVGCGSSYLAVRGGRCSGGDSLRIYSRILERGTGGQDPWVCSYSLAPIFTIFFGSPQLDSQAKSPFGFSLEATVTQPRIHFSLAFHVLPF